MKFVATSSINQFLFILAGGLLLAITFMSAPSFASSHENKDPRHMAMEALGKNMKAIARGIKAGKITPDMKSRATEIHTISNRLLALFPEGPQAADSRAKPEIWTDAAGFRKANDAFVTTSSALAQVLNSGEISAAGPALKATGKTCGGCHKPYRLPKK